MNVEEIINQTEFRTLTTSERNILRYNIKKRYIKPPKNASSHPLLIYIREHYPVLNQMDEPLTEEQATKILQDFNKVAVNEVLMAMANKKGITKDYSSTNLTLRNWLNRREGSRNVTTPNRTNISFK